MKELCQRYVDNLTAACALVKPQLEEGMTDGQILRAVHRCAEELFRLHQENDGILREVLFSKTPESLTEEEARDLSELAAALFDYDRSPDVGIAYYIHRLLYEYARYKGDVDLTIRELYYQGITIMYLNVKDGGQGVNLFVDQMGAYFREGASYLDRYEEITDPQTRGFIIRCLGNMKYGIRDPSGNMDVNINGCWKEYMDCFRRTMEIVQSPRYREMDPAIPWDSFVYTMHYDRTQFLSGLRSQYDAEIAAGVMDSAEYIYNHQEQIAKVKGRAIGVRTQYAYDAARFHSGRLGIEDLVETLFTMCEAADLHDFSNDNIWALLYVPSYLLEYCGHLPEDARREVQPRLQQALDKQREFIFLLPRNEYAIQVSRTMRAITATISDADGGLYSRLLDYVLACHAPTVVHSHVVARLAQHLCRRMARVAPENLEGLFGLEDAAGEDLEELLDLAYRSGLYHDLGKCMLLSYVGLYSRRLLDEEFACIKLHPLFGYGLLMSVGMGDMASVAYYHHRAYDRSGGYPRHEAECPPSVRVMVDIITVVDSLDAGTDNIGRSYAAAKTFTDLVGELRQWSGTRYAPAVVALFDDPDFCKETEQFLLDSRRKSYVEAYTVKSSH